MKRTGIGLRGKLLALLSFVVSFYSCDNGEGLFGHSTTKQEAKERSSGTGYEVLEYLPQKRELTLFNDSIVSVDTAWTEVSFTMQNGKRNLDSADGFTFAVPYVGPTEFSYSFHLADESNQAFTNPRDDKVINLRPKKLYDEMEVILVQKDTAKGIGWKNGGIVTDTILYRRIPSSK